MGECYGSDFIRATLDGKSLETRLNGDLFEVVVPPHPAGTNHTIILSTAASSLELTNLCFGDVYLLSGQSNMELPLSRVLDVSEAEILSMESDCVWIKGEKIGCTEYCYPPRRYTVKPGILKKRTQSDCYPAGCKLRNWRVCAQQPYYLETGAERVELACVWQYVEETRAKTAAPALLFTPSLPTGLFNASILPIRRVGFRAILWYQGESNAANPERYDEKFAALIKEWRALFGLQLPVICVEMPDYSEAAERTSDTTGWAEIQRM